MSKERPILFSAPMIRAILDGRKGQTRRRVKLAEGHSVFPRGDGPGWWTMRTKAVSHFPVEPRDIKCPYGVPGDRLWVRESYGLSIDVRGKVVVRYKADDSARFALAEDNGEGDLCGLAGVADPKRCEPVERWKPSIHTPRWASRLTLLIKSVRVERLQAISEADAIAEGWPHVEDVGGGSLATAWYRALWDQINGPGSWAANPWVWVVGFERINEGTVTA